MYISTYVYVYEYSRIFYKQEKKQCQIISQRRLKGLNNEENDKCQNVYKNVDIYNKIVDFKF